MLAALLATFLAGSILSLVMPAVVLIAVLAWYGILLRRGEGER
jgi:hypothetical protein